MSRGPGRIERAIAHILDSEADNAFTTEDLCERIYGTVSRGQRVAVLRAAVNVAKRRDTLASRRAENLGCTTVFWNADNVMSYAMFRLKADGLNDYRNADSRRQYRPRTEDELRALLDGDKRDLVRRGGVWWRHVQQAKAVIAARRKGDQAEVDKLLAAHKEENERMMAELLTGLRGK